MAMKDSAKHPNPKQKVETVDEFLARGGKVRKVSRSELEDLFRQKNEDYKTNRNFVRPINGKPK